MKILTSLLLFSLLFSASSLFSQNEAASARLTAQLDRKSIKYTTTDKGHVKVVFNLSDGRTQMVFIYANEYDYKSIRVREVKSTAAGVTDKYDFGEKLLVKVMEANARKKFGAWQLNTAPDTRKFLEFAIRIPHDASDDEFAEYIKLAASTADKLELEITAADEF